MTNNAPSDMLAVYLGLSDSSGVGVYMARELDRRPGVRVARDHQGHPAILFSAKSPTGAESTVPLELPNLAFRPRCVCRVKTETDAETTEVLGVLTCTSEDGMLHEYFLQAMSGLVAGLPTRPSEREVSIVVTKLVELFRALEAPPRASLQGLWCELFLIARHTQTLSQRPSHVKVFAIQCTR